MKQKLQSKKGFTLVELMIVVVIMGILVAVAIPVYNSATKNTKKKTCASNVRIIQENLSQWTMTGNDGNEVSVTDIGAIFGGSGKTLLAIKNTAKPGDVATDGNRQQQETYNFVQLFDAKTYPSCPFEPEGSADGTYKIVADTTSGTAQFTVTCVSETTAGKAHKKALS